MSGAGPLPFGVEVIGHGSDFGSGMSRDWLSALPGDLQLEVTVIASETIGSDLQSVGRFPVEWGQELATASRLLVIESLCLGSFDDVAVFD